MNKQRYRFLSSAPDTGENNMALDETLFLRAVGEKQLPCLRLYTWLSPCVTIGYFQKHGEFKAYGVPVIRRMTGGLGVRHGRDISYCFTADESSWPWVYDQEKTYQLIHTALRRGLQLLSFKAEFYSGFSAPSGLCVQTFFPYDLHIGGIKIVGSCQRRRGKTLLQQGSIHLPSQVDFDKAAQAIGQAMEDERNVILERSTLTPEETATKNELRLKYLSTEWNNKL